MNEYYDTTIELDKVGIDWITVTSFEPLVYETQKKLISIAMDGGKLTEGNKRLQYLGQTVKNHMGSLFCGVGKQKGVTHYMIQVSGELCTLADIQSPIAQGIREGWLTCRRLDLQLSVIEPKGWVQWGFFNRQKQARRSVGWVESTNNDGEIMQTVYVGARTSGKYLRVYEKWIAKTRILRAEYELKSNTAMAFSKMMFSDNFTPASLYKLLIQQTNDDKLSLVYLPLLEHVNVAPKPKILKEEPKTAKWLRETVYPSFLNYISSHNADPEIVELFFNALDRVLNEEL